jgi:hypothetical protein
MNENSLTIGILVVLGVATAFVGYYAWERMKKDFVTK